MELTDAQGPSSSSESKDEESGRTFDFKTVASTAGGVAFLCGWVYNVAFFSVVNYDFMDFVTLNDHVLSTLNALSVMIFLFPVSVAMGVVAVRLPSSDRTEQQDEKSLTKIYMRRSLIFIACVAVQHVFLNVYRRYWECIIFGLLSCLGAALSILVAAKIFVNIRPEVRVLVYGYMISFSLVLIGIVASDGAADAHNYMKGGLSSHVHVRDGESTDPMMVRGISNGIIVLYQTEGYLEFIPNKDIEYVRSANKPNRLFDSSFIFREMRP
jgi:hypothetical protein